MLKITSQKMAKRLEDMSQEEAEKLRFERVQRAREKAEQARRKASEGSEALEFFNRCNYLGYDKEN